MEVCLCSSIHHLATKYDEDQFKDLLPALNRHLGDLRTVLAHSKTLNRDVHYRITPNNQRAEKALFVDNIDTTLIDRIYERFNEDVNGFWLVDNAAQVELRRRLACVVIFLRSRLGSDVPITPEIARLFQGQQNQTELRNSGRKYIKISRKLGGLGSLLWLPLDVPPSTYERYLNIDDEEIFSHLRSLAPQTKQYTDFVQHIILSQLRDSSLSCSYYNLFVDYSDILPGRDLLLLLLQGLGGSNIPEVLLRSLHSPQRRWNSNGEIDELSAHDFGIPTQIISLLSDEAELARAAENTYIAKIVAEDGTPFLSIYPEFCRFFSDVLLPQTMEDLHETALKIICFGCPPCYEGNSAWSAPMKIAIWPALEKAANAVKLQSPLRAQVLETMLYFAERDSITARSVAVEHARALLRKSMPYYLHASVVLFKSILYRLDGELAKSEAQIRDFLRRGPKPSTRRDHAILGRLHTSQVENKIKCYDNDVPSFIYKWEAEQPISALETEVTFRLQSAAARFFQSVGDFGAAKASLEQFLSLNTANPMGENTRRVLVGRLADIYCETQEYQRAVDVLKPELDNIDHSDKFRRPVRRLWLASVEANIGLGRLEDAESALRELGEIEPIVPDDLYDQQLHMRRILASARIAHSTSQPTETVHQWRLAAREVERMYTLGRDSGFTAAIIYLSMAHAQVTAGDIPSGRQSWLAGLEILRTEKCEFWIPVVPTVWLLRVVTEIYETQGWTFCMMLPGGKPNITRP